MSDKFEEFKEQCIEQGKVKRLDSTGQKREAKRFENQAEYHMTAAEELLGSEADLIAIVEGYYSMLHKANEALALAGFKPDSHKCTMLGIRGVFERSDLAKNLQEGMDERVNVDYYMNPEKSDSEDLSSPDEFIENKVEPFIQEINSLIDSEEIG
jgi:uncharacterized protein (UPF0332 family)